MASAARQMGMLAAKKQPSRYTQTIYTPMLGSYAGALSYQQLMQSMMQLRVVPQYRAVRPVRRGSLRQELYGGEIGGFMEHHADAFRGIIQEDSEHQRVDIRFGWRAQVDAFKVTAICRSCDRAWSGEMAAQELLMQDWQRVFVSEVLAPIIERAKDTDCFGVREAALLAEWATNRLVSAGERGIPYVQIVHEAVEARLVTPRDVDKVIRDMKFVPEWVTLANSGLILPGGWNGEWSLPVLHLPKGHPLRNW